LSARAKGESELGPLPDPAKPGAYRPFATDPKWDEAWWWLGFPALIALLCVISFRLNRWWYAKWVNAEPYGILEVTHFILPLLGLVIGARLLFSPFVRRRPLALAVTIVSLLSCLYIAGEEVSWGQQFFRWDTPEYWKTINSQDETNLHNVSKTFSRRPRTLLESGVIIGGLLLPLAAVFIPRMRANRFSLYLPAAALMATAIGAAAFMITGKAFPVKRFDYDEVVETYLYFFMFAYILIFARRLRELGGPPLISLSAWMTLYAGIALLIFAFQIWIRFDGCVGLGGCALDLIKAVVWSALWPAYLVVHFGGLHVWR
jgi:hypothetical protein